MSEQSKGSDKLELEIIPAGQHQYGERYHKCWVCGVLRPRNKLLPVVVKRPATKNSAAEDGVFGICLEHALGPSESGLEKP